MTELVLAGFDAASAADAAVQDLDAARIPSAVLHREVPGNPSAPPSVTVPSTRYTRPPSRES